jgi:hypothetical protein
MSSSKRSVEKEEFWRLVLAEQATSGLSVRAFCKREAISEASFYFWRRESALRDARSDAKPNSPPLVPVRVVDSRATHAGDGAIASENAVVEVGLPGGFTLRAGLATDTERVAAWIAAILKGASS